DHDADAAHAAQRHALPAQRRLRKKTDRAAADGLQPAMRPGRRLPIAAQSVAPLGQHRDLEGPDRTDEINGWILSDRRLARPRRSLRESADRRLADDHSVPAVGLIEDSRAVRRTGVRNAVAALIVDGEPDDAELPAEIVALQPPHVRVLHPQ